MKKTIRKNQRRKVIRNRLRKRQKINLMSIKNLLKKLSLKKQRVRVEKMINVLQTRKKNLKLKRIKRPMILNQRNHLEKLQK